MQITINEGCLEASASITCAGPDAYGLYRISWQASHAGVIAVKVGEDVVLRMHINGNDFIDWEPVAFDEDVDFVLTVSDDISETQATSSCRVSLGAPLDPSINITACFYLDPRVRVSWSATSNNPGGTVESISVLVESAASEVIESVTVQAVGYTTPDLSAYAGENVTITVTANDSSGTTATDVCVVAVPDVGECDPPNLNLQSSSITSSQATISFTATTPTHTSTLTYDLTNSAGLPDQLGLPLADEVQEVALLDVSSLSPGQSFSATVTVHDDCDGKSVAFVQPLTMPCIPPTIGAVTASVAAGILTADYSAASPNAGAVLTVQAQVFNSMGAAVSALVGGTATQATIDVSGLQVGDYTVRVFVFDDCDPSTVESEDSFSICPSDSVLTVEWDRWDDPVESTVDGSAVYVHTIAVAEIPGWPATENTYSVQSYKGDLPDVDAIGIANGFLTLKIFGHETCSPRVAEILASPVSGSCPDSTITLTMYGRDTSGTPCTFVDESITCVANPPSKVMWNDFEELVDPCPEAQFNIGGAFNPDTEATLDAWWNSLLDTPGSTEPFTASQSMNGSGFADIWSQVGTFTGGRFEFTLKSSGIPGNPIVTARVKIFDDEEGIPHQLVGVVDKASSGGPIRVDDVLTIPLVSDDETGSVAAGDMSLTVVWNYS